MKTIIVAIDYSAAAYNALHYAAHLTQVFEAELILFNVYHPSAHVSNALVSPAEIDRVAKNNENRLRVLSEFIVRRYKIRVSRIIKTGDTIDQLADFSKERAADLVVMGMETDLTFYKLFGNTTTAAIRRIQAPVLVVPNDVPFKGIHKILYACEYAYLTEDVHLELLKEFSVRFDAKLQILHVDTHAKAQVPDGVDEKNGPLDSFMEEVDHSYRFVGNRSVREGIMEGVDAWNADLLVMIPHKAGFLELAIKGSATREMTLRTRVPLLILQHAL